MSDPKPCAGRNCGTTCNEHSDACKGDYVANSTGMEGILTIHHLDDLNRHLVIHPSRIKNVGGAPIGYRIEGFDTSLGPLNPEGQHEPHTHVDIEFQHGDPVEFGVNGITFEVLLAVQMHRLAAFQQGPFASDENARALHHLNEALLALQSYRP